MSFEIEKYRGSLNSLEMAGMQPKTLQKFETTVLEIAGAALEEYSPNKKTFDWDKVSEALQNAPDIKIKYKNYGHPSSGGAKMLGGLASLAVGAVAFNELGKKSVLLADLHHRRDTLHEFKGRLSVLEEVHVNNRSNLKVIDECSDIHDTASRILNRAQKNETENTALIGSIALNALAGLVAFAASEALIPVAIVWGGINVFASAFKWGKGIREKQLQYSDANKMLEQFKTVKNITQFTEIKETKQFELSYIQKRHYTTNRFMPRSISYSAFKLLIRR